MNRREFVTAAPALIIPAAAAAIPLPDAKTGHEKQIAEGVRRLNEVYPVGVFFPGDRDLYYRVDSSGKNLFQFGWIKVYEFSDGTWLGMYRASNGVFQGRLWRWQTPLEKAGNPAQGIPNDRWIGAPEGVHCPALTTLSSDAREAICELLYQLRPDLFKVELRTR